MNLEAKSGIIIEAVSRIYFKIRMIEASRLTLRESVWSLREISMKNLEQITDRKWSASSCVGPGQGCET